MPTVVVMKSVCERHFRPGGGLSLSKLRDLSIMIVVLDSHGVVRVSKANSYPFCTIQCEIVEIVLSLQQKCRHNTNQGYL